MSKLKEKLQEHLLTEVYCKLGVSPIHGIGVFALRDIRVGDTPLKSMVTNKEIKFSRDDLKKIPSSVKRHLSAFCLLEKGRLFIPKIGMNAVNLATYLNHSKTPNLVFDDDYVLIAIKNIACDEELTIDYDKSFGGKHDFSDEKSKRHVIVEDDKD